MFVVLREMGTVFGYPDMTIRATGMDHSDATNNAAMENESKHVIDCSVHVDRGMVKNSGLLGQHEYLEEARRHVRMLVGITDPHIFLAGCKTVLEAWRGSGNERFADWFEKVYLTEDWGYGSFYAGAGGMPGISHHNQCDESLFRSIKKVLKAKATLSFFFNTSVPDMLTHLSLNFCGRVIS
jgi:hypothetical protein